MSQRQDARGGGQQPGDIPRGIEVLVKKASIDPQFKKLLLQSRVEAAAAIDLQLDPAEEMMLQAVPPEQLETIIAQTVVPQAQRRAFLGTAATAMLAMLGVDKALAQVTFGVRPIEVPIAGIVQDSVLSKVEAPDPNFAARVSAVLGRRTGTPVSRIGPNTRLDRDLRLNPTGREAIRKTLEQEFRVPIPAEAFASLRTVGQVIEEMMVRSAVGREVIGAIARQFQVAPGKITPRTSLAADLKADDAEMDRLSGALAARLGVTFSAEKFRQTVLVGDLIQLAADALAAKQAAIQAANPLKIPVSRGVRPDIPRSYGIRPQ